MINKILFISKIKYSLNKLPKTLFFAFIGFSFSLVFLLTSEFLYKLSFVGYPNIEHTIVPLLRSPNILVNYVNAIV